MNVDGNIDMIMDKDIERNIGLWTIGPFYFQLSDYRNIGYWARRINLEKLSENGKNSNNWK
jgi:hypothetical protein